MIAAMFLSRLLRIRQREACMRAQMTVMGAFQLPDQKDAKTR